MSKPRVSVVIPTYNRQELVVEAIESVLAQTFKNYEVIVVDDGSTDDTTTRLRPYSDHIIYKKQRNQGVAAARNAGINLSQGEFICFLDSDDLWEPEKLETQIKFADAHPEYALLSTEIRGFDADRRVMEKTKSSLYKIHNGFVIEHLLFGNWIQTSTVMLRRKCLDEMGCFDEDIGQFGEDWMLWMRIASRFPIYFLSIPLVSYRYHPARLTLYQPEAQFQSLMQCLQKLTTFTQFQKKPYLLHEAEYRICLERAWRDRASGEYDLAMVKLKRASKLRRFSLRAYYQMVRTISEKTFKKKMY